MLLMSIITSMKKSLWTLLHKGNCDQKGKRYFDFYNNVCILFLTSKNISLKGWLFFKRIIHAKKKKTTISYYFYKRSDK